LYLFDLGKTMTHIHLIGIGGTGLSAIALVLLESGYQVSGSDRQISPLSQRVKAAGGNVFSGHASEHIRGADLVVRSSAIPDDNPEVQAALQAGIPVLKRAEFLGRLMEGKTGIAVAGTHGKTTTTAMIAWLLTALDQDPSYIIGGVSTNLTSNAHAGQGSVFVIEADEYDRMFLGLSPDLAVVTNIEHDHPDCYPTPDSFFQAFVDFSHCLNEDGTLLACIDDSGAAQLAANASLEGQRVFGYGLKNLAGDYQAIQPEINVWGGMSFEAICPSGSQKVDLLVPGYHNVNNALAALAVIDQMGMPLKAAAQALGQYQGTGRRFEVFTQVSGVTLVDDYAHHPTEIRATLEAARIRYNDRRIWAVWQPHTFSRTRTLLKDFAASFNDADRVLITDIYPAREALPDDGFSAEDVAGIVDHAQVRFSGSLQQTAELLSDNLQPGDVVLVMSAGDADRINPMVAQAIAQGLYSNIPDDGQGFQFTHKPDQGGQDV
jgi:UDP-N-acetylmuramate--alanine ligase